MDILKKINSLRLERGWSIYKLANESGITQSTLTNMFNRETLPSIPTLQLLCKAFGITLSEFFSEQRDGSNITSGELELLMFYRKLSYKEQEAIMAFLKTLAK